MKVLTAIAWCAPLVAIPFYFSAVVGSGMSPTSSPHANFGELLLLSIGPVASLAASAKILASGKAKPLAALSLTIPGLLSLAELAFTFLLWRAG